MEEHELDLLEDLFDFIDIDGPNAAEYKKKASDIVGMDIDQMISAGTFVTR